MVDCFCPGRRSVLFLSGAAFALILFLFADSIFGFWHVAFECLNCQCFVNYLWASQWINTPFQKTYILRRLARLMRQIYVHNYEIYSTSAGKSCPFSGHKTSWILLPQLASYVSCLYGVFSHTLEPQDFALLCRVFRRALFGAFIEPRWD